MEKRQHLQTVNKIHYYPGTPIRMLPGDVLYSHKTALSSFLVGHSGIVGLDYRIYHVNKWGKKGHADEMPTYLSRHKPGERLTILRSDDTIKAKKAAEWAMEHIGYVGSYVYTSDLKDIENNYCSKFVWQAFYFGNDGQVDLTVRAITEGAHRYIMPAEIYRNLIKIGIFDYDVHMR
ncbi:hypothetical protein [Oceanobacillus massiliensis]|uniref:hypothetical protein n=1 Tax=Oceanobacillus massiliensis TaxID=1465765 RepID=UPI0002880D44|nr:hypothetical protein [Oceanobacillus massiliensis]